jgi:hypothetical protein
MARDSGQIAIKIVCISEMSQCLLKSLAGIIYESVGRTGLILLIQYALNICLGFSPDPLARELNTQLTQDQTVHIYTTHHNKYQHPTGQHSLLESVLLPINMPDTSF